MGCLRRIIMLVVLLALLAGGWLFRDRIRTAWRDLRGVPEPEQPSEQLAETAQAKLEGIRGGEQTYVALSAAELESLLLYRYEGVLPAFLEQAHVELTGDQLRLRGRVPIDKLPRVQGLDDVAGFLPDTTELVVTGRLIPLDSGRVGFAVDGVSAAQVPLPGRIVPRALTHLGRRDEPGLPADAIGLPLPAGISNAYVRRDSLVLLSRPGATPQ